MTKLSERADQQLNPNLNDRIHVIHEVSGIWSSLYLKLSVLKEWINSGASTGLGLTVSDLSFAGAGNQTYQMDQYELIKNIIFKPTNPASTIKVGVAGDDDYFIEETTGNNNVTEIYTNEPLEADRQILITVSGACAVKILSVEGL